MLLFPEPSFSGVPSALTSLSTHPPLSPGIQALWSQALPFVLTAKLPVLGSSNLGPLHSQLESQILKLSFQWSQLSLPGSQSDSRQSHPSCVWLILALCSSTIVFMQPTSPCLWDMRSEERPQASQLSPSFPQKELGERGLCPYHL